MKILCKNCNTEISSLYVKLFCCQSCSAKFNNKNRKLSDITKSKISNSMSKRWDVIGRKMVKDGNLFIHICNYCHLSFKHLSKGKKICSEECLHKLNVERGKKCWISGKLKRVHRSKNEISFFEKIKKEYSDSIPNYYIDNFECDVFIPSLKIAIHWNGDWHYNVVITEELLRKIETKDKLKYLYLEKKGIENYIIKDIVSEQVNYGNNDKVGLEIINFLNHLKKQRCPC